MARPPRYDWGRAAELYKAGCNDFEIARQLGCRRPATIKDWRVRTGRQAVPFEVGSLQKEVATLHIKTGLSFGMIAMEKGISRSAVAGAVWRAKQRLKKKAA